jgi:AraC-like DNA-binding protein
MKLEYTTIKDEDLFILTDFNCQPSHELLLKKGLYKIVWCKEKAATILVDGYEINLKKDEVIFCTPFNVIQFEESTRGIISFVFNKQFYCIQTHDEEVSCNGLLFFGSSQPQIVSLQQKEKKLFNMIFDFFEEELKTKDHFQGEMLRTLLKRLLILSTRMIKENVQISNLSNAQIDLIRRYNLLVEEHFHEMHQVKDYADLLFKSPKTLSNLFKKYGEKSPMMIIHERILLEAKRLLLYSNKTNEEIAYNLGYKDAGHFSKFFKNNEGLSPTIFKTERLKRVKSLI